MDAQHLIKMANQIGDFFESMPDKAEAQEGVANHIEKFWDPRMRKAFLGAIDANQDQALSEFVKEAITSHRSQLIQVGAPMALEALLNRYSLGGKHLIDPGPSPSQIELIAKAALRAPDHVELTPFRLVIVEGKARKRLADVFEAYARGSGKSAESCQIEREQALNIPLSIAVIAKIDMNHPIVPAHEQWMCIGGAVTNALNAIHMLGYAGKMLSGGKVRDKAIVDVFCLPGETLVGWIVAGTPARALNEKSQKLISSCISYFK